MKIITLTTPMVGNYGVPDRTKRDKFGLPADFESYKIHASGLIVQDYSHHYSHWKASSSLGDWLKEVAGALHVGGDRGLRPDNEVALAQ